MDDYLVKPVDEATLIDIISYHLTGSTLSTTPHIRASSQSSEVVAAPGSTRDVQQAVKVAGGNAELAQELFEKFCQTLDQDAEAIARHATSGNWVELGKSAHRLGGSAALCAIGSLTSLLKEIEVAAREQQADALQTLMSRLLREVELTLEYAAKESAH